MNEKFENKKTKPENPQAAQKKGSVILPSNKGMHPVFSLGTKRDMKEMMDRANREDLEDTVLLALWDFAGQDVFYSMHHLFLTKTGVYLLVFDIRVLLQPDSGKDALSYLTFWANSINLHAPEAPLLLAATFCQSIEAKESLMHVHKVLAPILKKTSQIVQNEKHSVAFFPIDNKDQTGIGYLRSVIENVLRQDNANAEEIPVSWLLLLDEMLLSRRNRNYLHYSMVKDIAKRNGILAATELDQILTLFHDRGMVVHLTSTEALKSIVTINPQWLINCLSSVIRDASLHPFEIDEIHNLGLEKDVELLFHQALASRDILEYVWKNEQVDFLLNLMERLMLLSPWGFDKNECYLIPSLLNEKFNGPNSGTRCVFDFSSTFLPNGVFQRLVCFCIAYSGSQSSKLKEPKLFKNCAHVTLEPDLEITLLEETASQCISLFIMEPRFAGKALSIAQSMLHKLNADVMNFGLRWETLLEHINTGHNSNENVFIPYDVARKKSLRPWFGEGLVHRTSGMSNVDPFSFVDSLKD